MTDSPTSKPCFWGHCSDSKRCAEYGSCVANAQAGGAAWPKATNVHAIELSRTDTDRRGWIDSADARCIQEASARGNRLFVRLEDYERLQQRAAELEHNYKWLDDEMVKPLTAENERLRSIKNLPANLLGTMEQALREVSHAQQVGSSWYSRGKDGLYQQVAMWVRKGFEAIKIARDAEPPVESPNEGPIVNGYVQLPDGSGVLPAFTSRWHCSQCGRTPGQLPKDRPCSCGRVAVTKTASDQHTDSLIEKLESVVAGETNEPRKFTQAEWSAMPCAHRLHDTETQFHAPDQPCPLPPESEIPRHE